MLSGSDIEVLNNLDLEAEATMHANAQNFKSVAQAAALIQSLRRRAADGEDVYREVGMIVSKLPQCECTTAEDVVGLITLSQQVVVSMSGKVAACGDAERWEEEGEQLSMIAFSLGRAINTLEALLKQYAVSQGEAVN